MKLPRVNGNFTVEFRGKTRANIRKRSKLPP